MRNLLKGLLAAMLMTGAVYADTSTNKTFLAPRPVGVNLAMEQSTWHTQIHHTEANEDGFGGSFQATGFYQESSNGRKLGKYFGFDNKNDLTIGRFITSVATPDIDKRHLLHDHNGIRQAADDRFSGTLKLSMKHEAAGVRLDYNQDLDGLVKGMYFKVRAPIVWEKMTSNITVTNNVTATINADVTSGLLNGINSTTVKIADYFCGLVTQSAGTAISNQQAALTKAKLCGNHDKACLADIDVLLGWSFWEDEDNHAGINVGFTIPTGSTPDGEFMWEGQCGNRGHWGLGAGLDLKFKPWQSEEQALEIGAVLDWRYLFEDTEKRTLGLKGDKWSQYMLFGEKDVKGVFPAANVLTRNVDVRPGNQIDAILNLAYRNSGFTLDLGYNIYARESERVKIKEAFPSGTYGKAGNNYNSGTTVITSAAADGTFSASSIAATGHVIGQTQAVGNSATAAFLTQSDLDVTVAETPSQTTHKIYGGLGYAWDEWESPVMVGLGGAYEFASEQKSLETWSVWGKIGVSF